MFRRYELRPSLPLLAAALVFFCAASRASDSCDAVTGFSPLERAAAASWRQEILQHERVPVPLKDGTIGVLSRGELFDGLRSWLWVDTHDGREASRLGIRILKSTLLLDEGNSTVEGIGAHGILIEAALTLTPKTDRVLTDLAYTNGRLVKERLAELEAQQSPLTANERLLDAVTHCPTGGKLVKLGWKPVTAYYPGASNPDVYPVVWRRAQP